MQKRIIFRVPEIKALRIQCCKCKDEVVLTLREGEEQKNLVMPHNCPGCNRDWNNETVGLESRMVSFTSRFQSLVDRAVDLQFEIDGDEV